MENRKHVILRGVYPKLLAFALSKTKDRAIAEDLVQQAYLKAIQSNSLPSLENEIVAWMITVIKNLNVDRFRGPKLSSISEANEDQQFASESQESIEVKLTVQRVLYMLGERCREILLFRGQGYTTEEIAIWTKRPPGTIGREMIDCLKNFKSLYDAA